jgi:hypothetical protein
MQDYNICMTADSYLGHSMHSTQRTRERTLIVVSSILRVLYISDTEPPLAVIGDDDHLFQTHWHFRFIPPRRYTCFVIVGAVAYRDVAIQCLYKLPNKYYLRRSRCLLTWSPAVLRVAELLAQPSLILSLSYILFKCNLLWTHYWDFHHVYIKGCSFTNYTTLLWQLWVLAQSLMVIC